MGIIFDTVPACSVIQRPEQERLSYIESLQRVPIKLREFLGSPRTGAYIRGLTKTFDVPLEKAPTIAFAVLRVAVGEKPLGQLGGILSAELPLPNDKAQKIAQEIEKELFGPVMLEFNKYLAGRRASKPGVLQKIQVPPQNVLNLKTPSSPPSSPKFP